MPLGPLLSMPLWCYCKWWRDGSNPGPCISDRMLRASCHWDPFSAWAYGGTVSADEGLQVLTCISARPLRASCHWNLSAPCAYGGIVTEDEKAPIPDPASLPVPSGPHAIDISSQNALERHRECWRRPPIPDPASLPNSKGLMQLGSPFSMRSWRYCKWCREPPSPGACISAKVLRALCHWISCRHAFMRVP